MRQKDEDEEKSGSSSSSSSQSPTGLCQMLNMINNEEYESSEDEDFVVSSGGGGESDDDDDTDSSSDSNTLSTGRSQHSSDSDADDSSSPSKKVVVVQQKKSVQKNDVVAAAVAAKKRLEKTDRTTMTKTINAKPICCICLNEQTDETNELVSCDSCGFYTHEGCYGIWDTESKKSSDSSASTEPWFCDSCLNVSSEQPNVIVASPATDQNDQTTANKIKCFVRSCELCPNIECGLMKETENGKFVHTVCALYTPGVEYQNTDKLWPVVLDGIPYTKWGEQPCSLCENVRLSRTGVCIKCDAGMCKTYFHASCGLRVGYLPDPNKQGDHDPFIGYCKQHNEKSYISARRTNYLAMMSCYRVKNLGNRHMFEADPDQGRISAKFKRARDNYGLAKSKLIIHSDITRKTPRMLTTCPAAMKRLLAKNPHQSFNEFVVDQQNHSVSSVTFTTDFVKHYFDREIKIPQYYKQRVLLKQVQADLTKQEAELTEKSEQGIKEAETLRGEHKKLKECFLQYLSLVQLVRPDFITPKSVESLLKPDEEERKENGSSEQPPLTSDDKTPTTGKKRGRKPKSVNGSGGGGGAQKSPITTTTTTVVKVAGKRGRKPKKQSQSNNTSMMSSTSGEHHSSRSKRVAKYNDPIPNEINLDASCKICKQKTNTHLLVGCDTCKAYYHITCLDPPLASVPKKTKLYGWECSKCVFSKDNSSEMDEEEEKEQKTLRRERKARNFFDSVLTTEARKKKTPSAKKRKSELEVNSSSLPCPDTTANEETPPGPPKEKKKRGRKPKVQTTEQTVKDNKESDDDGIFVEEKELMNHKKARGAKELQQQHQQKVVLSSSSRSSLPGLQPVKSRSNCAATKSGDSDSETRSKRKSVDDFINTQ